MAFKTDSIARIKNYFLKGVLAIYIAAFTSLYVQVQTIFGDSGIVPIRDFASSLYSAKANVSPNNIVLLAPKIALSYGTFIELLCLLSVLIAFGALITRRLANAFSFALLWYIYYSICNLGQGFMSFHCDLLLLEVGFITILLAPLIPTSRMSQSDHDPLSFFFLRWLVFRYFLTNVLNVYLDNDKAWYNLTAIPMVAQGVQFPSHFSWYIYNLPLEYIKLYQGYEHAVKLCAPFLMFVNLKYSRLLGFYSLLFVALPSALFFNFGWTDLLISVCLLSFFRDAYFHNDKRARQSGAKAFLDITVVSAYLGLVTAILIKFFGFKYEKGNFKSEVLFTPAQVKLLADHLIPISLVLGSLGLLVNIGKAFFSPSKRTSLIKTLIYSILVTALFLSTFPTLMRFSPGLENKVKPLAATKNLSRSVAPLMLSNNYLLLSKVSENYADGRAELQLQGRASAEDPDWKQFDLRYKPGSPSRGLTRVVPHVPRVDLKMWYAARSSLQANQWLNTFAYRVANKERDVINVISPSTPVTNVAQIRVATLRYKYSPKSKQPFAGYWSQYKFISEYMPATNLENLRSTVKSSGISLLPSTRKGTDSKIDSIDKILKRYLELSSDYIRNIDHTAVIWSLSAIAAFSLLR